MSSLLQQSRVSRSESSTKGGIMAIKELDRNSQSRMYPGSLHRHQRSNPAVPLYRSMLDVDTPSLQPIVIQKEESMEDWVSEKLSQTARKHITNDWADILCFYTATNGVASAAPPRASPAPQPNGKAVSQECELNRSKGRCTTGQRYAKHCPKKVDWLCRICEPAKSVAPQECPKRIQFQRYGSWYVGFSCVVSHV